MEHECAYCGSKESTLEYDHIIPRHKIVIDTIDNMVLACRHCNATKGDRDPFEWYGLEKRYEIPRIVLGKYLKLIYEIHERQGTLERTNFKPGVELNIYDLGVILPSKTE
jgi:CRISPR/Cas system Type II protein with McrA/HNH and RuvC-like nuclease domain